MDADRAAAVLDLTESQRDQLRAAYRNSRLKRVRAALDALELDPRDHRSVFDEAHELFADQDNAVRSLFGPEAEKKIRQSQIRTRTVVLALLAAHAGLDWDETLAW
jgi:Spy/CpxP family protein refolding chaperone